MKLAEGLQIRADLQKRISQLSSRLTRNANVQEGEAPHEQPTSLLAELDDCINQLENVIKSVNKTNSLTVVNSVSLTDMLAKRDCMKIKINVLRDFLNEASDTTRRATRSEIKIFSTVSIESMQKNLDKLSQELRSLDTSIQSLNWTVELIV